MMQKVYVRTFRKHIVKQESVKDKGVYESLCGRVINIVDVARDVENEKIVCFQCRRFQYMVLDKALGKNGFMEIKSRVVEVVRY